MKIDGNKFMKWLHVMREKESKEANRIGKGLKYNRDLEISRELAKRYRIPIIKV